MTAPDEPRIATFSGVMWNVLDPKIEDVRLIDIATHLSMSCRFGGAVPTFYSVAQHSVLVSMRAVELAIERGVQARLVGAIGLIGLLHDAAEAYPPGDILGPYKRTVHCDGARELQLRVERVVFRKFGIELPDDELPGVITQADKELLATEQRDITKHGIDLYVRHVLPLQHKISDVWGPERARLTFLRQFQQCSDQPILEDLELLLSADSAGSFSDMSAFVSNDVLKMRLLLRELGLLRNPPTAPKE